MRDDIIDEFYEYFVIRGQSLKMTCNYGNSSYPSACLKESGDIQLTKKLFWACQTGDMFARFVVLKFKSKNCSSIPPGVVAMTSVHESHSLSNFPTSPPPPFMVCWAVFVGLTP